MDSILDTIKKMLGISSDYLAFDTDIIVSINSAFMILNQLGGGPTECFSISSKESVWSDFLGTAVNLEAVKTYIYLKVRILFDPPTNSAVLDAMNRMISEHEFRLNVQVDHPTIPEGTPEE